MGEKHQQSSASSELLGVSLLPGRSDWWSSVVGSVTLLSETSIFLTGGSKTSEFSFVVFFRDDPVDSWVLLDGVVIWVNADDLEEFVGGVLTNPVGVKNSHVGALSTNLLFSNRSVGSGFLELSNTSMDWLTIDDTLMDGSLSSTSSDSNSVDDVSLLLLESEGSGLIQSWWSLDLVDNWKLSVLPASDSEDESNDIRLLLSPELLKIFVCSHYNFII